MSKVFSVFKYTGGLFCLVVLLGACHSSATTQEKTEKPVVCKTVPPKLYIVYISQMKFDPADLHVHNGDTVAFVNNDMVTHDITEETTKAWTSGQLPEDSSWKFVVTQSSDYYCSIHPTMKGKITME